MAGRRIDIRGTVQGVGFRPWVARLARKSGVRGAVRNEAHGVRIDAFAPQAELEAVSSNYEKMRLRLRG